MSMPTATNPIIEFNAVTKTYGMGEAQVDAIKDVNFKIYPGDFVAIMGPSGSGKSTAMNIIGCLDTPTSGNYHFDGAEVGSFSRDQRALLRRNFLGFIFQGYNLLPRTSALENVELPLIYQGINRTQRRKLALEVLDRLGLKGRESHTPSQLSGGQQQRVAIARAIITKPDIILADEPTGNLDTKRSQEIMEILSRLNQQDGITIIMVTHEPEQASYANRLIEFVDGEVISDQTTSKNATAGV